MPDGDYQSSQSAALIGSNDDLLTEILHRLPVISILRFKSVSKHWRSLLNHRRFTLMYDKSLVSSPGVFVRNLYVPFDVQNQSSPPFSSLDFYPDSRGIKIVQSCNGLLLCCSNKGNEDRDYYVFNPTTKQFAIIPPVSGWWFVKYLVELDDLAATYLEIIRNVQSPSRPYEFEVLDVVKGEEEEDTFMVVKIFMKIIRFNIVDKSFKEIFDLIDIVHGNIGPWDVHRWFVKYLVELDDLAATYLEIIRNVQSPSRPYEFEVLDVVKGEEEEDTFMVVKIFMKIIRFNIMDKSFKEIFDLIDTVHGNIGPWDVHRYTKTLTYV
nr:hypothetical protein [Tanacetum cinerariifolium]